MSVKKRGVFEDLDNEELDSTEGVGCIVVPFGGKDKHPDAAGIPLQTTEVEDPKTSIDVPDTIGDMADPITPQPQIPVLVGNSTGITAHPVPPVSSLSLPRPVPPVPLAAAPVSSQKSSGSLHRKGINITLSLHPEMWRLLEGRTRTNRAAGLPSNYSNFIWSGIAWLMEGRPQRPIPPEWMGEGTRKGDNFIRVTTTISPEQHAWLEDESSRRRLRREKFTKSQILCGALYNVICEEG